MAFRTIGTYGTVADPGGISQRTTRDTTVLDRFGHKVYVQSDVRTDTGWSELKWEHMTYNIFGHQTSLLRSTGELITGENRSACCGSDEEVAADGFHTQTFKDALDRVTSRVQYSADGDPGEDVLSEYDHDPAGRVLTETVRDGANTLSLTTTHLYDTAGRRIQTTTPDGLVHTTEYLPVGRTTIQTAPGNLVTVTERYLDGRIEAVSSTGTAPQFYEYGVDDQGNQWTAVYTGSEGTNAPVWQKTVTDLLGRTIRTERPGYGGTVLAMEYEYNNLGQLVRTHETIDGVPEGPATLYSYDELGRQIVLALDLNDNGVIDYATDRVSSNDTLFVELSGDWWKESRSYIFPEDNDATALLVSIQRQRLTGLAETTTVGVLISETVSIDIHGNETVAQTWTDRDAKEVTQLINSPFSTTNQEQRTTNRLLTEQTSSTGVTTTYAYDALGRPTGVFSSSSGGTRSVASLTAYNTLGQVASVTDAASNTTTFVYEDATGRRIETIDALSQSTHTAYDLQGRVTNTWGATYPVAYEYDAFGRMTAMHTWRDEEGTPDSTQWQYDLASGLLTNKVYADGKGTAYTYTPQGQLATRTWARGVDTTYSYDDLNQLTAVSYSDSTPGSSFTYDRLGRQVTITDLFGTRTNEYDAATLQLIAEKLPDGTTLARAQDNLGRPSGIQLGPDYTVEYAYDALGRFHSVSFAYSVVEYTYLQGSDLLTGWSSSEGNSHTRSFEPNRNLITGIENLHGTDLISSFAYTNDELGRRTVRVDSASITNTFGYNLRSEVIAAIMGANDHAYAYDPIGNRLHAILNNATNTYTANELNQYISVESVSSVVSPVFDDDGNMIEYGDWTFTWDGENRLVAVASNSVTVVENQYDYMSRRIMKATATETNEYLYDGWNLLAETSATATNHYIWGLDLSQSMQGAGGVGGLLMTVLDGVAYSPSYDANGNVTEYTDTNGTIVAHYEYDSFGKVSAQSGDLTDIFVYRFSTKYSDDETGLAYYGYRFLNPELGRWLNRDPIGEEGGRNLYSVVHNAPINLVDLFGLVGTITVTTFEAYTSDSWVWHERGWWFFATWTPPSGGDWDKPCECKPCKKVLWLQKASWYLRRPIPFPDIYAPWHDEWTEAEAGDYGRVWDCEAGSDFAGIGDKPYFGVAFLGTVDWWGFVAESYVKCVEGKDAGTVYGKVNWGARWTSDTVLGSGPHIQ